MSSLTPARFVRSAFWVTLAFVILELALWLVLPRLLDAAVPDLQGHEGWTRIALWVLLLVWLLWMGVLALLALARARWVQRLLGEGQALGGPLAEALQRLEHQLDQAEDALTRLGPLPGGRPRPWIMMIGGRGAGKSSAVRGSELSVFQLDPRNSPFEVGPTQGCDWLHCGDAVVLDTAGRYTTDPQGREEWIGLLSLLSKRRWVGAIDAIVVTVNLGDLVTADSATSRLLIERLRRQLDDVVEVLGIAPPAHLLLTHLDRLDGFVEFFRRQTGITERPWGWSFPAAAQAKEDLRADFLKGFDALVRALEAMRQPALSAEQNPDALRRMLLFPAQLMACREPLAEVVRGLTAPTALADRAPLVGFWLTSARPGGPRLNAAGQGMDAAFGLARSPMSADPAPGGHIRPHFLKPLFASLMTTPASERLIADGERARRARGRRRLLALALLLLLLGTCSGLWYGVVNLRLVDTIEGEVQALQEGLHRPSALTDPDTLAAAIALGDLTRDGLPSGDAEARGALVSWAYTRRGGEPPTWWRRLWSGAARWGLRAPTTDLLTRLARRRVVEPAATTLERELQTLNEQQIPDLERRAPGEPLSAPAREWASRAWTATELARRWKTLQRPDPARPLPPEEHAELVRQTAAGIGGLLERMRALQGGGDPADRAHAADAETALAELWLGQAPPESLQAIQLPSDDSVRRVRDRLAPISGADLLYGVSLEETARPHVLELQSSLLRWDGKDAPSEGPHGFTQLGCKELEDRLAAHAAARTFEGFKGDGATSSEELTARARTSYTAGYLDQWARWIESFSVSRSAGVPTSLAQIPAQIDRVYRVGDGDLELVLSRLGRGDPLPPPPEGQEGAAPSSWCACQQEPWWISGALTRPDGALHKPLADLQAAMIALGRSLEPLGQDSAARVALVRDTVAQKGPLADVARAEAELIRAIEAARPPPSACAQTPGEGARKQQVAALIEQVDRKVMNDVWTSLLHDYQQQAELAWKDQVRTPWARISGQFPLDGDASTDADADEVKALLGTSGTVDVWFAEWVTPLLDQGTPRTAPWIPAPRLLPTDTAQQILRNRTDVARVVDRIDGAWDVSFGCTRQANSKITLLTVAEEGKPVLDCLFQGTMPKASATVSPASKIQLGAFLLQGRGSQCLDIKTSGSWAFYRLLQKGLSTSGRGGGRLTLTGNACTASWLYEEGANGPFATYSAVRRLGLPEQIFIFMSEP